MSAFRPAPRPWDRAALLVCTLVLGVCVVYPVARLAWAAALAWDFEALRSGKGWAAVRNTLVISLGSVAGAGLLGVPLAVALARWRFPFDRLLGAVAYLPFTMPPLVGTLAFYYLIGRDGLLPRFLQAHLGWADAAVPGPWAILAIHTYSFYVFFYAMAGPAVAALDHAQTEAARTLGAGPWRAFFRVTLPQLAPAILGASLLTFMSSAASFSAPYFFGGDYPVLSVRIFEERGAHNEAAALTLTVALAAVSLVGVALFTRRSGAGGRAAKGAPTPLRGARGRWIAGALAWCGAGALLTPHATILWLSFVDYAAWHTELVPTAFTLDNYRALWGDATTFAPIRNSAWMSAAATAACLAVALPAAYLVGRGRPGGRWVNLMVMLPWALPGTVIAMMLIVAFNERWLPVYNTVWILPLAYFVRGVPLMTRMAAAAVAPFDASLVEAARVHGAGPVYAFRRVVLPLIAPAVLAAMALVFATSLGEFVASILLFLPANLPISVRINMEWRADVGVAFAYSVLLMALVGATFYVSRRVGGRVI